jgi:membrane dipeptidase
MTTTRRDFLSNLAMGAGAAAAAGEIAAGEDRSSSEGLAAGMQQSQGGVHSVLAKDHPYIFVDGCMQMWRDANFANAHSHGVTAYTVTAWNPNTSVEAALEELMFWHLVARRHSNLLVAETAEDIRRAKREGKAALVLAAQDGDWIDGKLHRVEAFRRLGLRMMLLAYNRTNQLCDGCLDRTNGGLTRFGQLVVDECNRVGIVLDCSHVGKKSALDTIDRSRHPCVFSHSNPSSIVPNPRNIDDEQIKSCATRGGVVALVTWGPLVMRPDRPHWPTVDEYIDLIDYVAQLLGNTNNIGISTDMSIGTYPDHVPDPWGTPGYPSTSALYDQHVTGDIRSPRRNIEGFTDYAQVVSVAERLTARGYKDEDVRKFLGGNLLRVFEQVWASGEAASR